MLGFITKLWGKKQNEHTNQSSYASMYEITIDLETLWVIASDEQHALKYAIEYCKNIGVVDCSIQFFRRVIPSEYVSVKIYDEQKDKNEYCERQAKEWIASEPLGVLCSTID